MSGVRNPSDSAAKFLHDAEAGRTYRELRGPDAAWRTKPVTEPQRRELRRLGVNPFLVTTRGEASDAIEAAHRRKS